MEEDSVLTEIVEEIDKQDRHPTRCTDCGEVADGLEILSEFIEDESVTNPWICPDCRPDREGQ